MIADYAQAFIIGLDAMGEAIHHNAMEKGFWPIGRSRGEAIALIHSEISEALEGVRKPKQDDHCPEFTSEVIEMADAMIRIIDYCEGYGLPLGEALVAKHNFNLTRPHKHGKAF